MAIYRQIPTSIWADNWLGALTSEEKLVWCYVLTNSKTTQCGVYEFAMRYAVVDTGLPQENLQAALKRFERDGKIRVNEKNDEVMIVNWLKFNSARSPKVAAVVDKEINDIKTKEFADAVISKCHEYKYPIKTKQAPANTVSIGYPYSTDTLSQPEPTPEPTPEPEPQPTERGRGGDSAVTNRDMSKIFETWENIWGTMSPITQDKLTDWAHDFPDDVVVEALSRADANNKTFAYAEGILRRWDRANIRTVEQVQLNDQKHEAEIKQRQYGNRVPKPKTEQPAWADPNYQAPAAKEADVATKQRLAQQMAQFKADEDARKKENAT